MLQETICLICAERLARQVDKMRRLPISQRSLEFGFDVLANVTRLSDNLKLFRSANNKQGPFGSKGDRPCLSSFA